MKVGLVNDYPAHTGIGNYAFSLFSRLRKVTDIEMLYLHYGGPLPHLAEGAKVLTTPLQFPALKRTLNWYLYFPSRIPGGYDLYHASNQYLSGIARYKRPCIVSCMDIFPILLKEDYPLPLRFFLARVLEGLREARGIIAISEYTKEALARELHIPRDRIEAIPLGVETELFRPRDRLKARMEVGLPSDAEIILHVGSEEPRKNIPTLLKAFSMLHKRREKALLVRDGEERRETRRLVEDLGLGESVRYYHGLSKDRLALLYNASDIFAFPSLYEGFGLPVLEAMASGLPTVASNTTSIPEVVGDAGRLLDPMDPRAWAETLGNLLGDEGAREEAAGRGLARARSFTWEAVAERTRAVYEGC